MNGVKFKIVSYISENCISAMKLLVIKLTQKKGF